MYNNRSNFNRNNDDLKTNVEFQLAADKDGNFKTITTKDGEVLDLFEFWVINEEGNEVQCVVWNDTAKKLNSEYNYDNFKKIIITYRKKFNNINGKTSYSVRDFTLTN